ncbi:VOC family protein [Actibacterium sp. D379-3]
MTTPIIKPKMHHVNLKTTRLQAMIDWYGNVIGTRPLYQFEGGAWLSNDDANHRVALIAPPGLSDDPEKTTHTGMHHSAFEYDSLDDLLHSFERLVALGIKPHMTLDHGMTTSFYYLDPDGNSVELQSDNFGDWSESAAFMIESKEFAANPIGVAVDPAAMLAARRAGRSVEEVQKAAYAGEFPPSEPQDPQMPIEIPA